MEGPSWLLLLCVSMFFGSYLSGLLPLNMSLSPHKTKKISLLGAGLLVGTALIVIIPEGVHMLYSSSQSESCHGGVGVNNKLNIYRPESTAAALNGADAHDHEGSKHNHRRRLVGLGMIEEVNKDVRAEAVNEGSNLMNISDESKERKLANRRKAATTEQDDEQVEADGPLTDETDAIDADRVDEHGAHDHSGEVGHWQMGAALAFGFAFQVIVDRMAGSLHSHAEPSVLPTTHAHSHGVEGDHNGGDAPRRISSEAKSVSALIGLLVHALCDGVALGAAMVDPATTAMPSVAFVVFLAIMLHKGPSAFGLVSYLLTQGMSTAGVQTRLLLFSIAAPVGTILTYVLLSAQMFSYSKTAVAMCMLFSGGTFLYVATAHILPEIQHNGGARKSQQDDDDHAHNTAHYHLTWHEVGYLVAGVLLPLFVNIGHSH